MISFKLNKETKKSAVFIVFIAAILSLAYFNRSAPVDEDVGHWLKMQSMQINSNAPFMVDESQRLDNAQVVDKTMVYTFTLINAIKSESDIGVFSKEMTAHLYKTACPNETVQKYFRKGAKLEYKFLDKNSENVFSTTLTKEICDIQ